MPARADDVAALDDGPSAWRDLHALILALERFRGKAMPMVPRAEWPVKKKRVRVE